MALGQSGAFEEALALLTAFSSTSKVFHQQQQQQQSQKRREPSDIEMMTDSLIDKDHHMESNVSNTSNIIGNNTNNSNSSKVGNNSLISIEEERYIRRRYASSLISKADFESAIVQHLTAETPVLEVLELFPDLWLPGLRSILLANSTSNIITTATTTRVGGGSGGSINQGGHTSLTGTLLHRAASALVTFCEHHRTKVQFYGYVLKDVFLDDISLLV